MYIPRYYEKYIHGLAESQKNVIRASLLSINDAYVSDFSYSPTDGMY
jgi:hypothetical protein